MGASEWRYFVPYQPNINQALEGLRQQVFEREAYFKSAVIFDPLLADEPDEVQAKILEELAWQQNRPQPHTIAELLEHNGEAGTHSIIDIERVADTRDFGVAAPLTPDELIELFGTTQPTREMIAEAVQTHDVSKFRRRWEGLYVIVYQDGRPSEILF